LLASAETIVVSIGLHRIPDRVVPYPLPIPLVHPLIADPRICIFAQRDGKDTRELLVKLGLGQIKVIGLKKLEKKYKPFEMRRKLAGSYHLFACEASLQHHLRRILGKSFFARSKYPTEVQLDGTLPKQIEALRTATFLKPSRGVTWTIKVGSSSLAPKDLAENAINAINASVAKVPGKWTNIRGLHLKSETSVALPIYSALPPVGLEIEGTSMPIVPTTRIDPRAV
jgi:ribosome biogenesis protein UTP30